MTKYISIILLYLFASNVNSTVEQVSSYDSMSVSGHLKAGQSFSADIDLENFDCKNKNQQDFNYWGVDGYCPTATVKKITFCINNKIIDFPESAYSDLADVILPVGVYVMQSGENVKLYIEGGDGVAAYTAVFIISSGKVTARQIKFMDVEGEPAEKTKKFK